MRPIKLTVYAFGPYADEMVFDFALLEGRSFFLIHGPTGAGKTSILDAICFALYGETSGSQRLARQMRSDHATPTTLTKVIFDFALGQEVYRVERMPEQLRPKRRGEGMVRQEPEATLWRRTGVTDAEEGAAIAAGWNDVNQYVQELMGFKCDQFRQVVLLPQGQFAKLLTDPPALRQQILEALFQVEGFAHIEAALRQAALEAERQLKSLRDRRSENLRQASAATVEELDERRAALARDAMAAAEAIGALRSAKAQSQEALARAREVEAKLKERDSAVTAMAALEARREQMALRRAEHDRAVRAAKLLDAEAATAQRQRESDAAARKLESAQQMLAGATQARQAADAALEVERGREPQREAARAELTKLVDLVAKVGELTAAKAKRADAERAHRERLEQRGKGEAQLEKLKNERAAKEADLRARELLAAQAKAKALEKQAADRAAENLSRLQAKRKDLADAARAHVKLERRAVEVQRQLDAARVLLRALQDTWSSALAASLAQDLAEGQPCPVCGSPHHPSLAKVAHSLPKQEQIDAARDEVERIERAAAKLRDEESAARTTKETAENSVQFIEAQVGADAAVSVEEAKLRAEQAARELERAEAEGIEAGKLQAVLSELDGRLQKGADYVAKADADLANLNEALCAARAVAEERAASVPQRYQEPGALAAAREAVERELRAMTTAWEAAQRTATDAALVLATHHADAEAARQAADAANMAAQSQRAAFQQRFADEGFASQVAFQEAKRSGAEIERLDAEIRRHAVDVGEAKARLQRANDAATGLAAPDLAALEAADRAAGAALEAGVQSEARLAAELTAIDQCLAAVREIDRQLAQLDERYAVVGQIAAVANGDNPQRISFQRYVLGVYLDEVLAAATQRLRIMSRGRYLLRRAREAGAGVRKAGLELTVHDNYTSTERPVSTLSGGETFLAALSLALGLADVVQSRTGGIHLDTIFVDEGFGGLDPESLDLAIRALRDLQQRGRLVGIISHVAELKEWIDARLEVTPDRRGSVARFVIA